MFNYFNLSDWVFKNKIIFPLILNNKPILNEAKYLNCNDNCKIILEKNRNKIDFKLAVIIEKSEEFVNTKEFKFSIILCKQEDKYYKDVLSIITSSTSDLIKYVKNKDNDIRDILLNNIKDEVNNYIKEIHRVKDYNLKIKGMFFTENLEPSLEKFNVNKLINRNNRRNPPESWNRYTPGNRGQRSEMHHKHMVLSRPVSSLNHRR